MKEEYHAMFVAILQIIYQQKRLAYFSNHIAITLISTKKGKEINQCSIMLTRMLIKLSRCQKQIIAWLAASDKKVATCYFGPLIEVCL
jgi:hypothetical protein